MSDIEYKPPIPTHWNKPSVESIASAVADKLDFQIGDSIEELVCRLGGNIKYGWQELDEIEGGSIVANSLNKFHISISEHTSAKRDRFTIAHELGHLFLHLRMVKAQNPEAGMRATRHVDHSNEDQKRAEWEANWFAAQLLMPRDIFRSCVRDYGIDHAASVFGVSRRAAEVRSESI